LGIAVRTYIGNIGCANDGKVFMHIHFELEGKDAQLTVTMSSIKAQEVAATVQKAVDQGADWLKTGVPPG
jgi:hypothetical protein